MLLILYYIAAQKDTTVAYNATANSHSIYVFSGWITITHLKWTFELMAFASVVLSV